jgi:hypothetical protein
VIVTKQGTFALLAGWGVLLAVMGFLAVLRLARTPDEAVVVTPDAAPAATSTIPSPPLVPLVPIVASPAVAAPIDVVASDPVSSAPAPTGVGALVRDAPLAHAAPSSSHHPLRPDQQDRLNALQRLCDQRTVTAAECAAKRQAIIREN